MPIHIANVSINDGKVSRDGNLTVTVNETYYSIGGNNGFFAGASEQAVSDNDSSYAYLDSYGDLYIETSGWPEDPHGRLAKIICAGGYITDIVDMRAYITESGGMRAHDLAGVWHNADTLANLNSKILDAVLIDRSELDGYAGITHASRHENGGADEISVAGLSGELADAQIPKAHNLGGSEHSTDTLANLNAKISDATLDDSSSARPPTAHTLGGSAHSADTLANLNAKISDATLDDSSASRTPTAHASSHENGGADEISVAGLSGELADAQPPKAHNLGGSEHNADTLANLNAKISDATLDDSSASRTPTTHASSHENGGGDEISVAGLSGELADAQTPKAHNLGGSEHSADTLANLNSKISDATLDDSSASRTPTAHAIGGSAHSADTLANLNAKISDATLDDSSASRTPTTHASSHQNGGADEISVAGLSGELADAQTPKTHASSHQNGGSDEIATATPGANAIPKASGTGTLASGWVPDGADSTAIHKNQSGEISTITEKSDPVSGDWLLIEDSAASNAKKKVQVGNLPGGGGTDAHAIHDNVAEEIESITRKDNPVDGDVIIIEDSESSFAKKAIPLGLIGDGYHNDWQQSGTLNTSSGDYQAAAAPTFWFPAGRVLVHVSFAVSCSYGNPNRVVAFDGFDTSGGTSIDAGAAVPLNTERKKTSEFTHSTVTNNSEVTIGESGTYKITHTVSIDAGSGNKASQFHSHLERDTGSGFSEVDGTKAYFGLLQSDANQQTSSRMIVMDLNEGDKLRVWAVEDGGQASGTLMSDGSGLVVEKVNPTQIGMVKYKLNFAGYDWYVETKAIPYAVYYEDVSFFVPWTFSEAGDRTITLSYAAMPVLLGVDTTVYIRNIKIRAYIVK